MAQKKDTFFLAARPGKRNADLRQHGTFERIEKNTAENPKENDNVDADKKIKKPFDKKAYRIKKYSKKYKLEQWEDQRRKKLLRNYYKEFKNEAPLGSYKPVKFDEDSKEFDEKGAIDKTDSNVQDEETSYGRFVRHPDLMDDLDTIKSIPDPTPSIPQPKMEKFKSAKKSAFHRAKEEMQRLKQSKEEKRREIEKSKVEKEKKLQEYKKKKADRFKKLSRKTKKGQPVMTGRLELLLEKIVKNK